MSLYFSHRDFSEQYISQSFGDVIQFYNRSPEDTSYLLDAQGQVILAIQSASIGGHLVISEHTQSVTSSNAISASHAEISDTSIYSIISLTSSLSDTSSHLSGENSNLVGDPCSVKMGQKTLSLNTSSFSTGLSVDLSDDQGVYVKTTLHGRCPSFGSVGVGAEYFLHKGNDSNSDSQPGIIISLLNSMPENKKILTKIKDLTSYSPTGSIEIQYKFDSEEDISPWFMTYEMRGRFQHVA